MGYTFLSQAKKTEQLTAEKAKADELQRQNQQNELANLIKAQNDKIRQLEMLTATATEAQKKSLELEKQRLDELKKKKADELAKMKADEETRKQMEAEEAQKDLDAKKSPGRAEKEGRRRSRNSRKPKRNASKRPGSRKGRRWL